MKYIEDFLVELDRLDIIVWAEDDRLRCNAPKGVLTAELRAELAERKVEILQFLQKKAIFKQAIPPRSREEAHSLSFAQQRLWFLAQLEGESATYNMPTALHLTGQLDERTLQEALTALIQRHESLRVCFPTVSGEATVRLNEVYNPLTTTDLSEFSEAERQCRTSEWMVNHAHTPFDLSTGPLLSLRLLKLGEHKHILLFNMHHIISDGWSIGVLIRELGQLYNAHAHNQAPQLSALPIQYSDYAAWQRHWLRGNVLEQQLAYWIEQLNGAPELLKLPTDFPRPAVMRYQGRHLQRTLDRELAHEIQHLSRQQGVTVFMTLLAAFNVLLFRYSGQTDLVVGSPIANRTHHQTEGLIGFFVNTLVLRTQINGEHTFSELLKQVRHTALEAYSRQDIPFEYLVEQLNPARSLSHSPLFQVAFALQNTPQETLEFSGLEVSFLEPETMTAKFDLTLSIEEQDGVLMCDWEYDTDLFRSDTITRMTEHFQVLLEGILKNSEQSLAQLPLLTEAEQHQLLAWNHTATSTSSVTGYPKDHTIVELFQAQVENTPDNIAVVSEDRQLSYRELNTNANRLAQYLMTLGVGAETLVGMYVERSLEMVIGVLGILKAGGAYVPLDPEYPQQRVQFMLEDADVKVVLSQPHLLERLPVSTTNVVCLESEWEQIATGSGENPVRQSGPENLAYVIYTSGSTGAPKGVMVEHRNLCHSTWVRQTYYSSTVLETFLLLSPVGFDSSVAGIFWSFIQGAILVLPDKQFDISVLTKLVSEHCVTHLLCVPILYSALLSQPDSSDLTTLKAAIIAGESGSKNLLVQHDAKVPNTKLFNEYGPTEGTVWSSVYYFNSPHDKAECIGQPIANTQIYILDAKHNPAPLGIPGELCIAGAGLARGYLNRPELTAEKFIDIELFGTSQRIYKTGDLARWRPDGNLEYLGRLDRQVKLRGFRIELGEIEVALTKHSKVQEAAVIVQEELKDRRLLAYFVPQAYNQSLNSSGTVDNESQIEQVEQWQQIFDENYGQPTSSEIEPTFNPIGWNSSYTRLPISKAEMKEWANGAVDRILSKSPDRILEIGCGTGMLLFQIAPHCHHYIGTDISSEALRTIEQQKKTWEFGSKVTLFQRAADNFEGIEHGSCDAIILNSVIQYFPSIDYLITVLT
ncbi:MAG: amino acid adenylation domain-containing protein, partial [bacterium]|nr:amino acid adenylation domain-containing protein [bacterium]